MAKVQLTKDVIFGKEVKAKGSIVDLEAAKAKNLKDRGLAVDPEKEKKPADKAKDQDKPPKDKPPKDEDKPQE